MFILIILLKVLHVWLPIKLGFWEVLDYWWRRQQVAIFVWDFWGLLEHKKSAFSKLIISYVERICMNKGENIPEFFVWCDRIYQICRQAIYAWLLLTLGYQFFCWSSGFSHPGIWGRLNHPWVVSTPWTICPHPICMGTNFLTVASTVCSGREYFFFYLLYILFNQSKIEWFVYLKALN